MPDCPRLSDPLRLRRLLNDELPEAEQSEWAAHLEHCKECSQRLSTMAAESRLWNGLRMLRDLDKYASPATITKFEDEPNQPNDELLPLGVLENSPEPGILGTLGTYKILKVIGRGGMGIVFLARDQPLDRLVAIKVLAPGLALTGAARRRFAREAKAVAAVVHEHVVSIHSVDVTPQGIPYLVMQYIPGKSVQDLIDSADPIDLCKILRIGMQASQALAAAHAQGLIHRDVKPGNILLENGVERVKITDFGLARAVDDETMTQSGVVAGTPQYMAPEQALGDTVDQRADLFSLGSVLYALCTGRAPFHGRSSIATLKRVCEDIPPPIASFNPNIPAWFVQIVERLHAKFPGDRYGSAEELAELLGRCLAHVQQPSTVPLPIELARRPIRRKSVVYGAVVGCLLLGSAGLLGNTTRAGQMAEYIATVLRLRTPDGILVIEADDPDISIKVDQGELTITGGGVKELRLPVGPHSVTASKEGKTLRAEIVTITRGSRKVLSIHREAENKELSPPPSPAFPSQPEQVRRRGLPKPSTRLSERSIKPEATRVSTPTPKLQSVLRGHKAEVRSVAFSHDGRTLASGSKDGDIILWKMGKPDQNNKIEPIKAHKHGVESVAFSPDGKSLVSGGWDHLVKMWDVSGGPSAVKSVWDFPGHTDGVRSVAFSPDGALVIAGGFDRIVTVCEALTAIRVWTSPQLEQPINGVAFAPDGRSIALAMGDYSKGTPGNPKGQPGEVQIWNWPSRTLISTHRGWDRECKSVAFSPDGLLLAATSGDGSTRLYHIRNDQFDGNWGEKSVLRSGPWTAGVAFSPDRKLLATSNWTGTVILWDPVHGKPLIEFNAHDQNIPSITFSPDSRTLAVAGTNGTIKLWDIGEVPQESDGGNR